MAYENTDLLISKIDKIEQEKEKGLAFQAGVNQGMQIAGATGQGGSPGQLYKPPVTNPRRGEAVYGTEKDGQRYFEFLKAMMIDPANNIRRTGKKPLINDDDYGEGEVGSGWKISHSPSGTYDEYGRELKIAPYKLGNPSGELIEIPWMKEEYEKEHPELEQLHNEKYHQAMDYPPPSELDKWLQLYQRNSGSLRHLDPDLRKLILQRGAMKAELPANNIRRLRDTGHKTDYTGSFRLGDDGQLIPQLGIRKADASNNIRRLSESGHQTVLDDNRPGNLKIIKQRKPRA